MRPLKEESAAQAATLHCPFSRFAEPKAAAAAAAAAAAVVATAAFGLPPYSAVFVATVAVVVAAATAVVAAATRFGLGRADVPAAFVGAAFLAE